MLDKTQLIDELFVDVVAEMLNIGMGCAAASLSEMVESEVILSVPSVEFVSRDHVTEIISKRIQGDASGVIQRFNGAFWGDALLLFPEDQSLELVRAVLQNSISLDDLTEMQQEAMTEIGNVILNACLSSLADIFNNQILGEIPVFVKGPLHSLFNDNQQQDLIEDVVLFLNMDFSVKQKNLQGYVTFLMDINSVAAFKENVENIMAA
jgi:chemotaxis protein CheC